MIYQQKKATQSPLWAFLRLLGYTLFSLLFCLSLQNAQATSHEQSASDVKSAKKENTKNSATPSAQKSKLKHNSVWGFYPEYPKVDYGSGEEAELVKKGEYLVRVGDCISCHTDTRPVGGDGKTFAGGLPLETPFGQYFSPNITPDGLTGIGKWTEQDFINAMHNGKRPHGSNLFPVFPFIYFTKVSENDLRAIWAYLQKLPKVHKKNKAPTAPIPFRWRFTLFGWRMLFFDKGEYKYDPKHSKQWNRGAYLVQGLGHCGMCHTPMNSLGAPKKKYFLTGNFVNHFWAPNITQYGVAEASPKQIVDVFKEDELIGRVGEVVGPMAEVNHNSLKYLKTEDLFAIAVYLKTVKSKQISGISSDSKNPHWMQGRFVFKKACSTCHLQGQMGAPRIGDVDNWGQRIKKGFPTLYRNAINGYNLMPYKGTCVTCSDSDIEAAVDYIVNKSLTHAQLVELKKPKALPMPTQADGQLIYKQVCSHCHKEGLLGAPKFGDKEAWKPVLRQSMDVLITSTINGKGKMPAKGGCKHCNTAEIIAAIKYMVKESSDGDYSLW